MLKSLRISNYRAFGALGVDELSRINLISGRNNSGKTTLLEALLMLSLPDIRKSRCIRPSSAGCDRNVYRRLRSR